MSIAVAAPTFAERFEASMVKAAQLVETGLGKLDAFLKTVQQNAGNAAKAAVIAGILGLGTAVVMSAVLPPATAALASVGVEAAKGAVSAFMKSPAPAVAVQKAAPAVLFVLRPTPPRF